MCPNKYVARRRRSSQADFSTELVTRGASGALASAASGARSGALDYSAASGAVGVDTSAVGATVAAITESIDATAISDTSGVKSFSNLIINGQEIYDAMTAGAKPSQYGQSWGSICSDLGSSSAECPSWGKFEWCQPGFKYFDASKAGASEGDCTPGSGIIVVEGQCYTC